MNRKPERNPKLTTKTESGSCGTGQVWSWLSMIVIWGSVLLFVSVASLACGARLSGYGSGWYGQRMMAGLRANNLPLRVVGGQKCPAADTANFQKTANSDSVFGVISRVEKNIITILDNSANEQTVISLATTTILSATGERGLSDLKEGQGIRAVGARNADNQLEAQIIKQL